MSKNHCLNGKRFYEERIENQKAGFDDFIRKPFNMSDLLKNITMILEFQLIVINGISGNGDHTG
ncbi:MAG: hypothetical protein JEZ06_14520 [Anaerolineaceae bacterium]|nr:hypothetical protein [Anaerolineaceae bacterium]